jgi:hypothetical protein
MKKKLLLALILIIVVLTAGLWALGSYMMRSSESGFVLVSLKGNALLISDPDVLSYNWTSQEITLTDQGSQRLKSIGDDLYSFSDGFIIKIDGQEMYRGVFRSPIMSAIPSPPQISIMYPSMLFPSELENYHAIRMFYPAFQPSNDQPEKNLRLFQYFEVASKLTL